MKLIALAATTGIIQRGGVNLILTREAIESIGNADPTLAIPVNPGHDPFCMPIGKVEATWVEPYDEEFAAMAQLYIEDKYQHLTHIRTETSLVLLDFENSPKPFMKGFTDTEGSQLTIATDLVPFEIGV